jgi:amino acid adenylation domain-containing protein/non-ribosomal peptide synthase protein (TIGR01720 family)
MLTAREGAVDSSEEFWRSQFPTRVQLVSLPPDKLPPPVPSFLRDTAEYPLDRGVNDRLSELSVRLGVPPLAILLAALKTVLFRYARQETLVIGAAVPKLDSSETSHDGFVLVPIQTHWDTPNEVSAEDLARDLARRLTEARTNSQYSLRDLQSRAGARDSGFGERLFNVALCADDEDRGLDWPMFDPDLSEFLTQCDLVIAAVPNSSGTTLRASYDSELFELATVERLLGHVAVILEGFVSDSSIPVLRLPLLSATEQEQLLIERNASDGQFSSEATLHELFEAEAERRPGAVALTCDGKRVTYGQLNARANRLARQLVRCGVKADTLVGICLERTNELVTALLAILKAGGAYLPIDLAYPAERLAFMLEDAEAPLLITQRSLTSKLPETKAKMLCVEDLLADSPQANQEENLQSSVKPDHLAYVIYTSGTTGKPKGSMITHRNVTRLFSATQPWFGFDENDVWTLFHSCAFDFSVWEIWGALLYGGRVVVVPFLVSRSPEAFYDLLAKEQVTVLSQTPSAFRQLIRAEEAVGQKELALRYVVFGGEALEMQSLRPWFERHGDQKPRLINMYGITETTVHVTYRPLSKSDLESGSVIGVQIPDLQVYILDPLGQPVPLGIPGEMYVGGAGLARGYLRRPELTAERFVPDHLTHRLGSRLYKTGDLARFLPGRDIEYLGRIDHQVKIRGFRIELGEIESVMCKHPAVREVTVIARGDSADDKRLVAYVVARAPVPAVSELRDHLRKTVPDYMVPSAIVFLDELLLTSSGKIDLKALPEPEQERPELETQFVMPRTAVEAKLAEIWSRVLRLERVGIHDNFFELGGDSILSIQVIALSRQSGITLSPKLLFQNQTIAKLAAVATVASQEPKAEQTLVQGGAPLTPIQHWFFKQELADPNYYNQSFLFIVKERLDMDALERALAHLERHHDALRMRFATIGNPDEQTFALPSPSAPLERVNLSDVADHELSGAIEAGAAHAQTTLDFIEGPMWRAVYFDCGSQRPARLLLAIHHLAVDGVSWRILLEDLERAYQQERAGEPAELPLKTTSVREWAERLSAFVNGNEIPGGTQHWRQIAADASGSLPVDLENGENTESSSRTVIVRLEVAETDALLQQAPSAYNTQINDLLLAALGQALHEWIGGKSLHVNVEGHGREDFLDGVDLSRTVGWFTSIYPVRLQLPDGGIGELIKSVKEQLRSIPARGIGYGLQRYLAADPLLRNETEPQILFNYLGRFDQVVSGSRLFGFSEETTGPWHSPRARRRYLLEVNSLVMNGRLEFSWIYSPNRHLPQTIEQLAQRFLSHLRQIVAHCTTPGVRGRTPSDFSLCSLDQRALDVLVDRIPNLEDVYGLSPIQTLFYAAGVNDSREVLDHWHGTLTGTLDVKSFQKAWELVSERHSVLRSSFQSAGLKEPVQVVHSPTAQPWRFEDWRGLSTNEQVSRWDELLKTDRAQGMMLDQAPLSRLALIRLDGERFKFLWTVPALLLDGWSWPLVFRDLSCTYDSLCRRQPIVQEPAPSYREYLAWLRGRQEGAETEQFWRTTLQGVTEPTPLTAEAAVPPSREGERRLEWSAVVGASAVERLGQLARQLQITPNTLIQAAWALVLSRLSGRSDVVFGAAFSGRPTDLHGAEGIVGPFVNSLPVRVKVDATLTVREYLQQLHVGLLRLNPHQFAPLTQIQSWTEVPWRHRLFDSIVVVQNYLVDDAARRLGNEVAISDFVGPIHTNFPLLVLVEPETAWRITLVYDQRALPTPTIQRWGQDIIQTLVDLPASASVQLDSLLEKLSSPHTVRTKPVWRAQSQNYVSPQTDLERRIARVWEEMLQLERISAEENVFDLGVHSLLAVQLHRRLCETLGQDFPLISMFQYPTIQLLARHLKRKEEGGSDAQQLRSRAQLQRKAMARLQSVGARKLA